MRHNSKSESSEKNYDVITLSLFSLSKVYFFVFISFSLFSQIRWLNTIRSPMKIFFMVIVPPVLLIVGLSILNRSKNETNKANLPEPLHLTPNMYLKPGSQEDYATFALLQNTTSRVIDYIMEYFADYKIGTELVSSMGAVLNSSSRALYNLGFNIRKFPAAFNLSRDSVSMSFLLRVSSGTCCIAL